MQKSIFMALRAGGGRVPSLAIASLLGIQLLFMLGAPLSARAKPASGSGALIEQLLVDHPMLTVPDVLKPWLGWVLHSKDTVLCPKGYDDEGENECSWPARLSLNLRDKGGTFSQTYRLYRSDWVILPGSGKLWPSQVRVDGKAAVVVPAEAEDDSAKEKGGETGSPRVYLSAGEHVVTGSFFWDELPESLPIPPSTGLITLSIGGKQVPSPSRQEEGILYLDKDKDNEAEEKEADALDLTVHRKVIDEIPLQLVTRISLRVAGKRREVTLGKALPTEFTPMSLTGGLPARLDEAGRLKINLRPGTFELVLTARKDGQTGALRRVAPEGQWPADEIWVFEARPMLRGVAVEGVTALDPQQTTLPGDWKGLPAFPMRLGDTMTLRMDRRGDQNPVPDRLELRRTLWLDFDGEAFTAHDEISGTTTRMSRLEMLPPMELGRVSSSGKDQVITRRQGLSDRSGVELRSGSLSLSADSRLARTGSMLPAVGFNADFSEVGTTLQLPPGWRLFHASGADEVTNTWLHHYTLVDLFWALLLTVAIARILGIRWGAVALVALCLGCAEPGAPRWSLLALLGVEVLLRLLPSLAQNSLVRLLHLGTRVAMVLAVLPFAAEQAQFALHPARHPSLDSSDGSSAQEPKPEEIPDWVKQRSEDENSGGKRARETEGKMGKKDDKSKNKIFAIKGPPTNTDIKVAREAAKDSALLKSVQAGAVASIFGENSALGRDAEDALGGLVGTEAGGGGTGEGTIGLGNLGTIGRGSGGPGGGRYGSKSPAAPSTSSQLLHNNAFEIDPNATAQTGPGLPTWTWTQAQLRYSGLVRRDQQVHLYLSPPWLTRGLLLLQVGLLGLLVLRLCGLTLALLSRRGSAAIIMILVLGVASSARAELPSDELLDKLSERILEEPSCRPICAASERLILEAQPRTLKLRMEIGAATTTAVPLPGSPAHWLPSQVLVDGKPATALRLSEEHLWLAVSPGSHQVVLEGPLPRRQTVQIALPFKPHRVEFKVKGWQLDGVHEDGVADDDLQLSQLGKGKSSAGADGDEEEDEDETPADPKGAAEPEAAQQSNLPPFVLIEREIQIGQKWQLATRILRQTPTGSAVVLEVPLLPGESVVTPEVRVQNGKALVNMGPTVTELSWRSLLQEKTHLELTAPVGVPWSESWKLTVSPLYHTELGGAPIVGQQDDAGLRQPQWRPWPGEKVTIDISRPDGIVGRTLTIDSSELTVSPGLRTTDVELSLRLRTSRGGPHPIVLPPTAVLTSVQIQGRDQPLQVKDGRLLLTLLPGAQSVLVKFQLAQGISTVFTTPEVDLGAPSVNAQVTISLANARWLLLTPGPAMGPAVMFWALLVFVAMVSFLLARLSGTPLHIHHFFLLGIGLTQASNLGVVIVVGWLLALGYKQRSAAPMNWLLYDLRQVLLVAWTAAALVVLAAVVENGLLGRAHMMLTGHGAASRELTFMLDRTPGKLPIASLVSLPIVAYQGAVLAWAVWLILALLRWLRWGYSAFAAGGLMLPPPPRKKKESPTAAPSSASTPIQDAAPTTPQNLESAQTPTLDNRIGDP